jgi:hypothetical protein
MSASLRETRTAAAMIRLATGSESDDWSSVSWREVAALAARERCIALAWLRSRQVIVNHTHPNLAKWWRDAALSTLARGHAHVETLRAITRSLAAIGVRSVILKGAPLSTMLYGEPGVRSSADLDIWIPLEDRRRAREVLLQDGWDHADGEPPNDEGFRRLGPDGEYYLEVHSRLLHSRFDYLPLPDPECNQVAVAGSMLPVMTGSLLPAYLAVQIAKHRFAPVLWLIDFRTLWAQLDAQARELTQRTARQCGLHRYLGWVLRRSSMLVPVAAGDAFAVGRLGLHHERQDPHPMWRHVRLAPSTRAASRALWAWLAPPWVRSAGFAPFDLARRVTRYWAAAVGTSRGYRGRWASTLAAREITVRPEQLLRVVREVSFVGGGIWISATGTSMWPTLLENDHVLLEPAIRLTLGDIVLADADGFPLLHRVVRMDRGLVTTRGDARMTADATIPRDAVIGRAVRVRRGQLEWSLKPSSWRRLRLRVDAARGGSEQAKIA